MGITELSQDVIHKVIENKASEEFFKAQWKIPPYWTLYYKLAQRDRKPSIFQYKIRDHCYTVTITHMEDTEEQAQLFSYSIQDVTIFQDKVKEGNDEIQAVFQSLHDGIFVFDKNREIIFANDNFAKMIGQRSVMDLEKEIQTLAQDYIIFFKDGRPVPDNEWPSQLILQGRILRDYELRVRRITTGKEWYFSFSGQPIYDNKGRQILMVCVVKDISQQIRIEEKQKRTQIDLENAVKARDEFLTIASHELKTPLTSLKLQTQIEKRLLAKRNLTSETPRMWKFLKRTETQVQHLSHLVEDMLDISRIASGKLTLSPAQNDLLLIVHAAESKLSHLIKQTGARITYTHQDSCKGLWDAHRIEQVVISLLTNAIKYGEGKPVEIHLTCHGTKAVLKIKDKGIGIIHEDIKRIFSRFERAISSNEVSGLGLGLFIAQKIVELHQGSITVETKLGFGSTFTVNLPIILKH